MDTNTDRRLTGTGDDPGQIIRRMFADGKLDANTATRQLLTLDSQRRRAQPAGPAKVSAPEPRPMPPSRAAG